MDQVQEVLKQSILFRELTGDELDGLERMGTLKEYAEFEAILKEGEVNDHLFIIITGTASIAMENTFLGVLDVGQHFGEMALLDGKPSAANIIANQDTTVFSIPHEKITTLVSTSPSSGHKILLALARQLCIRLRKTDAIFKDANQKNLLDETEMNAFMSELL